MQREVTLRQLLRDAGERMWQELNQQLVPQAGELGRAREEILREFLRRHLPQRFGVSSGFVFDSHARVSRQVDVVVHDRVFSPLFRVSGETEFFPVESVVCVGEVKSELRSKQDLEGALEVLRTVKALDRSAHGQNRGVPLGLPIDQERNHLDQVFTFVFAVKSALSEAAIRDTVASHIDYETRHLWPNLVFVYDGCLVTYACGHGICANPMDAQAIGVVSERSREILLLDFFLRLAMAVQATSVATFAYADYIGGSPLRGGDAHFFSNVGTDEQERLRKQWEGEDRDG